MKNTKKSITALLTIAILLSIFSIITYASDSDFEWTEKDGNAVITKYVGADQSVTVPDKIGGLTVTEIGAYAFQECYDVLSIELPESITTIGKHAFMDCLALKKIIIPDSVQNLGIAVFYSCRSLKSVHLPDGIEEIPMYTFFYCLELTQVNIPDSVTVIEEAAFKNCTALNKITLPEDLTIVGDFAFTFCSSLKEIIIPSKVSKIGREAFGGCTSLIKTVIANPDCTVYDDVYTISKSANIYSSADSNAKKHAEKYGLQFTEIQLPMIGDVDGNFNITAADARLALRISAKLYTPTDKQKTFADFDGDGTVNAADARKILRRSAHLE